MPLFKSLSIRIRITAVIATVVLCLIGVSIYLAENIRQPQTPAPTAASFTGINWYPHKITLQINDKKTEVDAFETFLLNIPTTETVTTKPKVINTSTNKQLVELPEVTVAAGEKAIMLLSADQQIQTCFIEADITNLLYGEIDPVFTPREYDILAGEGLTFLIYQGDARYLIPFMHKLENLPREIHTNDAVTAVVGVNCADIENPKALVNQIRVWLNFSGADLRKNYQQEVDRINRLPNYND